MAVRTVSILGGNWNAVTAWTGGVVPIAGDTVDFTALSGALTVNVSTALLIGINFTNYVNTITFSQPINTNGTVNLGTGGYTQAGSNGLVINGTTTISGTTTWSRTFTTSGTTYTITLSNTLNITGLVTFGHTGTLTFSTGANTFNPTGAVTIGGTGAITTLPNDINITDLTITAGSNTLNSNTINISGSLTLNSSSSGANISGTTNLVLVGTGTLSSQGAEIRNNLTINTTGTITMGTSLYYSVGTFTHLSGNVITTGNTLNIGSYYILTNTTTFDVSGINWNNVTITTLGGVSTYIFSNPLNVYGTFTLGGSVNAMTLNGSVIYVSGNLLMSLSGVSVSGTTTILFNGTGTWTHSYSMAIQNNIIINTKGTLIISGNVYYNIGTFTYISGKVITKNSTFNISSTTLINCHKLIFDKVVIVSSSVITMNEFFSGNPSLVTTISSSNISQNYTITFQDGFEKISKFVNINNCTLSKPLQLLVITNSPKSSTNTRGIRYINQSPNGIAKGDPSVGNTMTFGAGGLLSDPNMR